MDEQKNAQQYNNLHQKVAINTIIGTIQEVDVTTAKANVMFNKEIIHGLRIMAQRAGENGKSWWLPAKGEQVVVLAPFGDITEGIIIGSIYYGNPQENPNNAIPKQADQNYHQYYKDGSSATYDSEKHEFRIDLKKDQDQSHEDMQVRIYNRDQQSGIDILLNEKSILTFKQEKNSQTIQITLSEQQELSIINSKDSESVVINSPKKLKITSDNIELKANNIELIAKNVNVKKD